MCCFCRMGKKFNGDVMRGKMRRIKWAKRLYFLLAYYCFRILLQQPKTTLSSNVVKKFPIGSDKVLSQRACSKLNDKRNTKNLHLLVGGLKNTDCHHTTEEQVRFPAIGFI